MQFPLRSALSSKLSYLEFWAGLISYCLTGTCKTSGNFTGPYHHWTLRNGHTFMSRVLRFHDAVYMNHRSTFWSFPLKEQPDGQQQGPLTDNIMPDLDDSSDDTDDESL